MTFEEWLQSRLTAHGFAVGPIDGVLGPNTLAALNAFKKSRKLPADGKADQATVDALRLPASVVPAAVAAAVPSRAPVWPRQVEVPAFYGKVGTNQRIIEVPFDMFLAWDKSIRTRRMSLHTKVADSALRVLQNVAETYSAAERKTLGIDLFGGSLNVRKMRGGSSYSMHSWGIAIDFDPERNQLDWGRNRARLAKPDAEPFWRAWEAEGWVSLGRVRNFDYMHCQAARL